MNGQVRLSAVIGAMSYALDVTEGEPPGHAKRVCMIGMRLAQALGLDADTRSHLFYALLLKDAGCSANSARMAALFGADDHRAKRTSKRVNWSDAFPAFGAPTAEAIRALDEHWDGGGQPRGLRGEEIPLLGRILSLAQTAEIFHAEGGPEAAGAIVRKRSGGWFDPALADAFAAVRDDAGFWAALDDDDLGSWEPEDRHIAVDEQRLDRIADAFAGIIDAKSPWTYRHSDRACPITMGSSSVCGMSQFRDGLASV